VRLSTRGCALVRGAPACNSAPAPLLPCCTRVCGMGCGVFGGGVLGGVAGQMAVLVRIQGRKLGQLVAHRRGLQRLVCWRVLRIDAYPARPCLCERAPLSCSSPHCVVV
jgi:hypothetical protein